jgi:hypothetical protein
VCQQLLDIARFRSLRAGFKPLNENLGDIDLWLRTNDLCRASGGSRGGCAAMATICAVATRFARTTKLGPFSVCFLCLPACVICRGGVLCALSQFPFLFACVQLDKLLPPLDKWCTGEPTLKCCYRIEAGGCHSGPLSPRSVFGCQLIQVFFRLQHSTRQRRSTAKVRSVSVSLEAPRPDTRPGW